MSRRNYLRGSVVLALLAVGYVASHGVSQDKQTDKYKAKPAGLVGKKEGATKAPTYKIEKGPFKVEVTLKGVLEAEEMTPVALNLEAWPQTGGGTLIVHKACIEQLRPEERPFYQAHLAHILIPLQGKDGTWWDFTTTSSTARPSP